MKPSELKKDAQSCVRINSEVKIKLRKKGQTPQKIVDEFVDKTLKISKTLEIKG